MPLFECTKCGRRIRTEYDISCTGDVKRNVEKAPECCNKAMIEMLDE
jgi:sarcosine oxidase delta subunit